MRQTLPRIILIGFMCAGKTIVAASLASLLECRAIDLDDLITRREGRSISALINEDGEATFREAETRALVDALADETARVIALGGGTWTLERNRALIKERNCLTVWLNAPFELCWRRIESDTEERPLARDKEQARRLFDERKAIYALAAMRFEIDEQMPADEVAAEILSLAIL